METIVLALAITASILLISSVASPKLRAAIYSLPIPITILLLGTGGHVNVTHLVGLSLTLLFIINTWLLSQKLRLPIVPALILGVVIYVLLGMLNKFIVHVPFLVGYVLFAVFWIGYAFKPVKLHKDHYQKVRVELSKRDYLLRGSVIFLLAYLIIGIKGLIFGAAITFPFNGIFTAYVMRDQLPVLITETLRNFMALFTFFLVVWLLQPTLGLLPAIGVGWIICPAMIYCISRYLPRPYKV